MMTEEEKWHFDLFGYIVLKEAIPTKDVQRMVELANQWQALPDSQLSTLMRTMVMPFSKGWRSMMKLCVVFYT